MAYANRCLDAIVLRVDDGDRRRSLIDGIHFVAQRIDRERNRPLANAQRPIRTHVDQVEHADRAGACVRNVRKLVVPRSDVRETTVMTREEPGKRCEQKEV